MTALQRKGDRFNWTTDLRYLIGYAYQLPLPRRAVPDYTYEGMLMAPSQATPASLRPIRLLAR